MSVTSTVNSKHLCWTNALVTLIHRLLRMQKLKDSNLVCGDLPAVAQLVECL